jgi:hypothetical protein
MSNRPTTTPSWEPPLAGTDREHLLAALDRMRATFRWKTDGLDHDALAQRVGTSALTLAGLLKHLTAVEDHKSTVVLDGSPMPAGWEDNGWDDDPDWEFNSALTDRPQDLYARYDDAVARSRARFGTAVADRGLDQDVPLHDDDGRHASLRRLLHDLVEEYARHTGHADLLREAVDGRTGEDPPWDWEPPWVLDR